MFGSQLNGSMNELEQLFVDDGKLAHGEFTVSAGSFAPRSSRLA
jgi:hypothetical protein